MKKLAAITLLALSASAHSSCRFDDKWTGPDKDKHAVVGIGTGFVVANLTESFWWGLGAAALLGAAKEYSDSRHPLEHDCTFQDFAATAAGGALGAGFNRLAVTYGDKTVRISYSMSLH